MRAYDYINGNTEGVVEYIYEDGSLKVNTGERSIPSVRWPEQCRLVDKPKVNKAIAWIPRKAFTEEMTPVPCIHVKPKKEHRHHWVKVSTVL